jgi:hypothetical protein
MDNHADAGCSEYNYRRPAAAKKSYPCCRCRQKDCSRQGRYYHQSNQGSSKSAESNQTCKDFQRGVYAGSDYGA